MGFAGDAARWDGWTRRVQRRYAVPAVAAGVACGGRPVWVEVTGWADLAASRPADESTQFRIGSITKTFTAAVVVGLALRGKIDLDEPAESYLPDVDLGRVRIRHLLAHSAGVQREVPGPMWASMYGPDTDGLLAALKEAVAVDDPGAAWHYSNLGYAVLGQVVAAVTGRDCREVIDADLLAALGLASTSWQPPPQAATGYRRDPYQDGVRPEPVMDQGAVGVGGQLWSTVGDLLVWGDALAGGAPEVLPGPVVDAMHTLQVMADTVSWTSGWGLGLALTRHHDRVLAGHTGAMPGFAAALRIDRATRTVTTALASLTRGVDIAGLSTDLLDEALASPTGRSTPDTNAAWCPGPPCPSDLRGVLGRWWCEAEETIFSWVDGRLHAHLATAPSATDTSFDRVSGDEFRAVEGRLRGERLVIERDQNGGVQQLTWATYPYTRTPR